MKNDTLSTIHERRSHRVYSTETLSNEQTKILLQSALAAPSALNAQVCHMTLVTSKEPLNLVNRSARKYAMQKDPQMRSKRFEDPEFDIFYGAPAVIFVSAGTESPYAAIDAGILVENIALAAKSLGLGSVILGLPREGFLSPDGPMLEKALLFPEGHHFIIAIAIGHPLDERPAHTIRENRITRIP